MSGGTFALREFHPPQRILNFERGPEIYEKPEG